jgi:hypothetical protein
LLTGKVKGRKPGRNKLLKEQCSSACAVLIFQWSWNKKVCLGGHIRELNQGLELKPNTTIVIDDIPLKT